MSPRASLSDLRVLSSPPIARRAAVMAFAALVGRALAPVLAWTLVQRTLTEKVAVTLLFGGVFTGRTLLQRTFTARTEAELYERTTAAVLGGDVVRPTVLPDQDVRIEAAQSVFQTSQVLSQTLPGALGDLIACAMLGVGIALVEPGWLVASAMALTVVASGALLVSRRAVGIATARTWALQERVYEAFCDALEGRLEIVASGHRGPFMADFGARARAWGGAGVQVALATVLSGRLSLAAVAGVVAVALVATGQLRASFAVSLTDVALFASVTPAFVGVAQGVHGLARDGRWVHLLAQVMRGAAPERQAGTHTVPTLPAVIAFEQVTFRYDDPERPGDALSDVTLSWSGREVLALSGANGSGKSTCLRMLLGLASPLTGTVRVADVPLDTLDPEAWRAGIAFLPQRPYLPPRSDVRRAVRWPLSTASDERILQALERVGLIEVLRRTRRDPLDVRVDSLSVGERQRVALARLLCRDASLFLLDEPDANLDRAGIALVASLLRELAGRGMVAFAAHTPELLEVADRTVVLERGRVVDAKS
jgi:ABC-type bacteriocin/lantibiotic exporter with double-glycine peptidase domain